MRGSRVMLKKEYRKLHCLMSQKVFWLIALSVTGITGLQYFSSRECSLHELYRELYSFPLFIAAMRYGTKGALICLASIYALYLPYMFITWQGSWKQESVRVVELFFYLFLAAWAGYFADREKALKAELEQNRFVTSLGRITSGIVHDLKNPLISIRGLLERLAKGKGDCSRYLPVMLSDTQLMERIVYDVLDFAKPLKLKRKGVDLSAIIENAVRICREKAKKAGVSFDVRLSDISVEADQYLIERALVNIISNAIESLSEVSRLTQKDKKISIKLERHNNSAQITVRDNGKGMDKEIRKHCFEPYFSNKRAGTGLGLAIVKKIIDAHDGRIDIALPDSGGTAFIINLQSLPA